MSNRDKKWALLAMVAVASVMVVQPMVSLVFGLFYILYYLTRAVFERKLLERVLAIGVIGLLLAVLFFWGLMVLKYGSGFEKIDNAGRHIQSGEFKIAFEKRTIPLNEILLVEQSQDTQQGGCATLIPGEYCIPLSGNIAIQKGFGVVLFLLFLLSILLVIIYFKREAVSYDASAYWIPVSLVWSIFTFIGLESWALPFSVDPPRFFMFMTLPMAILVPKGVLIFTDMLKKYAKPESIIVILLLMVLYTSAYPKYMVQTAGWPYGVMWVNPEHMQGYVTLKQNLPVEAKVFPMCMPDSAVIGMDKVSYSWDKEVLDFRESILDKKASQTSAFLKSKGYEYAILDLSCVVKCDPGRNQTEYCISKVNKIAEDLSASGKFTQVWSNKGVLAYKIN